MAPSRIDILAIVTGSTMSILDCTFKKGFELTALQIASAIEDAVVIKVIEFD